MATKKWTQNDLGDLSGQTMVVTGASSGIGLVTARELCAHGARVILAVRDVEKVETPRRTSLVTTRSERSTWLIWSRYVRSPTSGPATSRYSSITRAS